MKKIIVLSVVICSLLLGGCTSMRIGKNAYKDNDGSQLTEFSYGESGMSIDSCVGYKVYKDAAGNVKIDLSLAAGELEGTVDADSNLLLEIDELMKKYNVASWNGFDEDAKGVMDGSSFSLSAERDNGTSLRARGSNSWPNGFGDFKSSVLALLVPYEDLVIPEAATSIASTDMDMFFFSHTTNHVILKYQIDFRNRPNEGMYLNYVNEDAGEHMYVKCVDYVPFDQIQALVEVYGLAQYNGYENYPEEGDDHISISVGYASGESINMQGKVMPDFFENFEKELVQIVQNYVDQNRADLKQWEG